MTGETAYDQALQSFVGRVLVPGRSGQDPVNVPMIRHWVEAVGDPNPVHLSAEAARATGRGDVVAPASMMQTWTMRGYAASTAPEAAGATASDELVDLLARGGYTSVVATDSEFEFRRELVPGDEVSVDEVVESISPEKRTGLGPGRFVTTVRTYRDASGTEVAVQKWRTLRFRPAERKAPRPRPAVNRDNEFWFAAAREKRLVIQRCRACEALRHPPGPCCPHCRSFDWDTVEASGCATVHSYVVAHHPRHPAFEYPLLVALVELAEGTRLISNLVGVEPDEVTIGMPVQLEWLEADPELVLPVFRPATDRA
ncbi:OB-fold domain-containing protein [Saccharopolyspora sp. NPDC000359]|uniref:bifunctional MaoC family dehydratase N-terminal/OB-fold nucleic acid binding domain-containing protein n=1 Tax=Saccharopolyspora sp. NPDC000359 TaxID=3154251 RepID=UPI00331CB2F2